MLIKWLCKMVDTRFSEGLGERSKEYEGMKGQKVWSMLCKRLYEMLVERLSDHLGERLGEIKTIHLQHLSAVYFLLSLWL
jgi:hypothetical protein